jgi:hypothetical protein
MNIEKLNNKIEKLKQQGKIHTKDISDTYHTIGELYDHRTILTASLFNVLRGYTEIKVVKSRKHYDGTMFDGMFIVVAMLSTGMISYHYNIEFWDYFSLEEVVSAPKWDGHTANDTMDRLVAEFCRV